MYFGDTYPQGNHPILTKRIPEGQPLDHRQRAGAIQPEPLRLRQSLPLPARDLARQLKRELEPQLLHDPPGARVDLGHCDERVRLLQRARPRGRDGHPPGRAAQSGLHQRCSDIKFEVRDERADHEPHQGV